VVSYKQLFLLIDLLAADTYTPKEGQEKVIKGSVCFDLNG